MECTALGVCCSGDAGVPPGLLSFGRVACSAGGQSCMVTKTLGQVQPGALQDSSGRLLILREGRNPWPNGDLWLLISRLFHVSPVLSSPGRPERYRHWETNAGRLAGGVPPPGASRQPSLQEKSQESGICTVCYGRVLPGSGEPRVGDALEGWLTRQVAPGGMAPTGSPA